MARKNYCASLLFMWYSLDVMVLRQASEVILTFMLPRTPPLVIILPILALIMWVVYQGIEAIGRCSEVIGIIVYLMVSVLVVVVLKDLKWEQLLPVYSDTGLFPILKGAVPPIGFLSECIMITMLLSFMKEPKKGPCRTMWGIGLTSLFIMFSAIIVIGIFGSILSARMWYPAVQATRYIEAFEVMERMDAVILILWIMGGIYKRITIFFITCYGTAQWLGVKNWRKLIWFVGPTTIIFAFLPQNIVQVNVLFPKFYLGTM